MESELQDKGTNYCAWFYCPSRKIILVVSRPLNLVHFHIINQNNYSFNFVRGCDFPTEPLYKSNRDQVNIFL